MLRHSFATRGIEAGMTSIVLKDMLGHSDIQTTINIYGDVFSCYQSSESEKAEKYYRIALLHDIGKIGVPDEVLNKHGKLTDEEFEMIKSHTTKGYEAQKDISVMPELATGARSHHERPDGKGYPNHLKGDEIPRVAKVIAVADTFDAMYSTRSYRARMNFDKAVEIIRNAAGTQLDPEVVEAFLRLAERGELRAPDDTGGGSTENIENIKE